MTITWTPGTNGLSRGSYIAPGWDDGPNGQNCKHTPKGDHGNHCSDWYYIVSNGTIALSLAVFAGNYPRGEPREPRPLTFCLHAPTCIDPDRIAEGPPTPGRCELLDGWVCFIVWELSYEMAEKHFHLNGVQKFEQPEMFWAAFEQKFLERQAWYAEQLKKAPVRCGHCNGTGVIHPI